MHWRLVLLLLSPDVLKNLTRIELLRWVLHGTCGPIALVTRGLLPVGVGRGRRHGACVGHWHDVQVLVLSMRAFSLQVVLLSRRAARVRCQCVWVLGIQMLLLHLIRVLVLIVIEFAQ